MTTLKETLNLLSDKLLSEVVTELTEKVHSLQLEIAVLKSENSDLLEKQQICEESVMKSTSLIKSLRSEVRQLQTDENKALYLKYEIEQLKENNQENLDMIDSLKTEFRDKESELETTIAALRSDVAAKSHAIEVIKAEYKTKQAEVENDLVKLRSEAAENEQKMRKMKELLEASKILIKGVTVGFEPCFKKKIVFVR